MEFIRIIDQVLIQIYGVNAACLEGVKPFELKDIPIFDGINHPHDKSDYLKFLKNTKKLGKPIIDKIGKLNKFYLPLSEWIYSIYKKDKKIKIIGLSGGQGAGKSTITGILKFILKRKYGLNLCVFSIDDFYKTKSRKKKMSKKVHPLFLTRGVPGTHDLNLINRNN